MMLKLISRAVLCVVILIGKIDAQEVIVAREKKTERPARTEQAAEQPGSESPTPAPHKRKSREKKAVPERLTLEEMRAAGARAAEEPNDRPVSQPAKRSGADVESAPVERPSVAPAPKQRETPVEQKRSSRSRGTNIEGMGPIRPTLMESGREAPSPSPSGR